MKQRSIKLTAEQVKGFKPAEKAYRVFDSTVVGLTLYVGISGAKSWSLNYTDRDKKRQTYRIGTTKTHNVVEARAKARKLISDIAAGKDPAKEKRAAIADQKAHSTRVLSTYLEGDYWAHHLSKQRAGRHTLSHLRSEYRQFLDLDMAKITTKALTAQRTERLNSGISPNTLNRNRVSLHSLYVQAIKDRLVSVNPVHKNVFPPLEVVGATRVRYLGQRDEIEGNPDGSERARFMAALSKQPQQIQDVVGLALETGCRRGELLALRWSSVSLRGNTLTVEAHSAKSNKTRHIPLTTTASAILTRLRGKVISINPDALVFTHRITGKQLTQINTGWIHLIADAKVADFRLHDCRHDFASRLVMGDVPLIKVRDLLGHASITMTERYSHLAPSNLQSAVDVLNEVQG